MNKLIYSATLIVTVLFLSSCGGSAKNDAKKDDSSMGPVQEDTLEDVVLEVEVDEYTITSKDTVGLAAAFNDFKKAVLKRDMVKIKTMIHLPMDISCLTSFNPKLADQLDDMMITEKNWDKYFNDLFSAKIVKLISHSSSADFNFTRVSDGSVLCSLTIAEKKWVASEAGGEEEGEGMLGYVFTFKTPSSFEFSSISCAGGGVTDRDIISK